MSYLILTRRIGEAIDLTLTEDLPKGSTIEIMMVGLGSGQARIGIDAPRSVSVDRREITIRKQGEVDGNVE